ncbi:hypothetical protein KCH_55120 [Kitasatospora cheerisanensis KCTC 2395]|uniref:Uncharacterized protein n=1 Tax=Kitasatospora cheerisanensis KCTC 2395 TaxID=1348663 RepID=A0A066YNL6_9ACTN|nr:hypothetical protein KCH_55120 [Kitasatospora cheerisanensis KCTC 2395]
MRGCRRRGRRGGGRRGGGRREQCVDGGGGDPVVQVLVVEDDRPEHRALRGPVAGRRGDFLPVVRAFVGDGAAGAVGPGGAGVADLGVRRVPVLLEAVGLVRLPPQLEDRARQRLAVLVVLDQAQRALLAAEAEVEGVVVLAGAAGGEGQFRPGGGRPVVERAALGVVGRVVEADGVGRLRLQTARHVGVVEVVLAARGGLRGADLLAVGVVQVDGRAHHRLLLRELLPGALRVVPDPVADLQRGAIAEHFEVADRGALAEGRPLAGVEAHARAGVHGAVAQGEQRAVAVGAVVRVDAGGGDGSLHLGQGESGVGGVGVEGDAVDGDPAGVEELGAAGGAPAAVVDVQHVLGAGLAGLVQVAVGPDRGGQVGAGDAVGGAVAEGQQHGAVGLEADLAEHRLGLGERASAARLSAFADRPDVRPRVPALAPAERVGGAEVGGQARVVERLVEHGGAELPGGRVEGQHDGPQVRGLLGGLAGADAADVAGAVLHAEPERPPVRRRRAVRSGDGVDGLGLGRGGRGGVVAVQLAVVEVDHVQVAAVLGELQPAEALLAGRREEAGVVARVRGAAGAGDGGEQRGGLRRRVGDVDRARSAGPVRGARLGLGGAEQPLVLAVPRQAEHGAGLHAGRQVGDLPPGVVHPPGPVREAHQRVPVGRFGGGGLAGGGQRGVLLAVVGRVPQAGDDGGLLARGEVDELPVAAQPVRRGRVAGGERRVQQAGLRVDHVHAVLAARGRLGGLQRDGAVGGGDRRAHRAVLAGQGDRHPGQARVQHRVVRPALVDRADHPDRHRTVGGGGRRGRRRAGGKSGCQ